MSLQVEVGSDRQKFVWTGPIPNMATILTLFNLADVASLDSTFI